MHATTPLGSSEDPAATMPASLEPVALRPSKGQQTLTSGEEKSGQPNVNGRALFHLESASSQKSNSLSSVGDSRKMSSISSIDFEKALVCQQSSPRKQQRIRQERQGRGDSKCADRRSREPEKGERQMPDPAHCKTVPGAAERIAYFDEDDPDYTRQLQEEMAVKILLFLSGPCALLSVFSSIWTIISIIITLFAQPIRVCARRPTSAQQLGGLIGPFLKLQFRSIYTPLPLHDDEGISYRPVMLVAVQLLSPFLSVGMVVAAWVVAVFWLTSAIVGDPAGLDRRDDGRETVLILRDWWEKWLVRSMREPLDRVNCFRAPNSVTR